MLHEVLVQRQGGRLAVPCTAILEKSSLAYGAMIPQDRLESSRNPLSLSPPLDTE